MLAIEDVATLLNTALRGDSETNPCCTTLYINEHDDEFSVVGSTIQSRRLGPRFVKFGTGGDSSIGTEMLHCEALGLNHLNAAAPSGILKVPRPVAVGKLPTGQSFIAMEQLDIGPSKSGSSDPAAALGRGLAFMHRDRAANGGHHGFGFPVDGCCGSHPQPNAPEHFTNASIRWDHFWQQYRLGPQLEGCRRDSPQVYELGQQVLKIVPELFSGYGLRVEDIKPSILHGDLWGGNWSVDAKSGLPCIYDPAAYYGHSEADLGIAKMFGGFTASFWAAYYEVLPKQPGHDHRSLLYEVHHHLNHLNMFGSGYESGCLRMFQRILQELKQR